MTEDQIEGLIDTKSAEIMELVKDMCKLHGMLMIMDQQAGRNPRGPYFTNTIIKEMTEQVRRRLV